MSFSFTLTKKFKAKVESAWLSHTQACADSLAACLWALGKPDTYAKRHNNDSKISNSTAQLDQSGSAHSESIGNIAPAVQNARHSSIVSNEVFVAEYGLSNRWVATA